MNSFRGEPAPTPSRPNPKAGISRHCDVASPAWHVHDIFRTHGVHCALPLLSSFEAAHTTMICRVLPARCFAGKSNWPAPNNLGARISPASPLGSPHGCTTSECCRHVEIGNHHMITSRLRSPKHSHEQGPSPAAWMGGRAIRRRRCACCSHYVTPDSPEEMQLLTNSHLSRRALPFLPVVSWPRYGYPFTKEGLDITKTAFPVAASVTTR
jgi:hypothetical protein